MISVRKALKSDVPSINTLLAPSHMGPLTEDYINDSDICLIAEDENRCIGCLWVGIMAAGIGYIDKFYVDAQYSRKKIGNQMAHIAFKLCKDRGIDEVFGIIKHSLHHDKSAINALKMGMGSDGQIYTRVCGQIMFMDSEIGEK